MKEGGDGDGDLQRIGDETPTTNRHRFDRATRRFAGRGRLNGWGVVESGVGGTNSAGKPFQDDKSTLGPDRSTDHEQLNLQLWML